MDIETASQWIIEQINTIAPVSSYVISNHYIDGFSSGKQKAVFAIKAIYLDSKIKDISQLIEKMINCLWRMSYNDYNGNLPYKERERSEGQNDGVTASRDLLERILFKRFKKLPSYRSRYSTLGTFD
jgi:hypothetical protein